jgi:hypothetical protein
VHFFDASSLAVHTSEGRAAEPTRPDPAEGKVSKDIKKMKCFLFIINLM